MLQTGVAGAVATQNLAAVKRASYAVAFLCQGEPLAGDSGVVVEAVGKLNIPRSHAVILLLDFPRRLCYTAFGC